MMDLRFFEIYRNPDYIWRLVEGIWFSMTLTALAATIGFVLATGLAVARLAKTPVLSQFSVGFVEFTRNTPLIVQLFFVAFGLPLLLGYQWPFWAHALLALTLNFSAYFAEILRAGARCSAPYSVSEDHVSTGCGGDVSVAGLAVHFPISHDWGDL